MLSGCEDLFDAADLTYIIGYKQKSHQNDNAKFYHHYAQCQGNYVMLKTELAL